MNDRMKRISERIALLSELAGAMHMLEVVEQLRERRLFAGGTGLSGFTEEAPSNAVAGTSGNLPEVSGALSL